VAAENASARAALRMTTEGAGPGRHFLVAPRNGAARPATVARTISQVRYSATNQVQVFRCVSAQCAGPEFITSFFCRRMVRLASPTRRFMIYGEEGEPGTGGLPRSAY